MKFVPSFSLFLLTVASAATGVLAAETTTSEYEPNSALLSNKRRSTSTIRKGDNVRKLSKAGMTDGTDGTGKSGKSSHGSYLEFLDPNESSLCPCFTSDLIDETWEAFKSQDPSATCKLQYFADPYGYSIETTTDNDGFEFYVSEESDDERRGRRRLETGETFGICGVAKEYDTPFGDAEATQSSKEIAFDADITDCVGAILSSSMSGDCEYVDTST